MQRHLWFVVLVCAGLACSSNAADSSRKDEDNKAQGKGTVVNLDGLRSRTPPEWKEEETASRMRLMQFRLPRVDGDPNDAELVIYKNLGGSAQENVKRWKGQFLPPSGKSIDDVATVKEIKIGGDEATYVDVSGTYNPPPFDPTYKGERQPDFRMLAIHFKGPENLYHIKLIGPAKTVEHYKKGFDDWLKGFKKG
jgi:hypothetical protein